MQKGIYLFSMHGGVLRQDITGLNCSKKDVWEDCGISNTRVFLKKNPKALQAKQISNGVKEVKGVQTGSRQ